MIGSIMGNLPYNLFTNSQKTDSTKGAFEDALLEISSAVEADIPQTEENGVPDRWTSKGLYTLDTETLEGYRVNEDALSKVKEQLRSEGISPDSRTPTHEITDEQMEWLGSRYDLDFLNVCSFSHSEYGNFMLDLAYLNVFSIDEVKNFFGVLPFNANHKGYLYKMNTGDGLSGYVNPFGGQGILMDDKDMIAELLMEYLKAKDPGHTEKEYEKMAEDLAVQRQERMSVITEFFARLSDNKCRAIPNITDMSGKISEEFGGLI